MVEVCVSGGGGGGGGGGGVRGRRDEGIEWRCVYGEGGRSGDVMGREGIESGCVRQK